MQLGGVGCMHTGLRLKCVKHKPRGATHNVAADCIEVKVEFGGRGEAAISQDARGQPPAAAHVTARHMRIKLEHISAIFG